MAGRPWCRWGGGAACGPMPRPRRLEERGASEPNAGLGLLLPARKRIWLVGLTAGRRGDGATAGLVTSLPVHSETRAGGGAGRPTIFRVCVLPASAQFRDLATVPASPPPPRDPPARPRATSRRTRSRIPDRPAARSGPRSAAAPPAAHAAASKRRTDPTSGRLSKDTTRPPPKDQAEAEEQGQRISTPQPEESGRDGEGTGETRPPPNPCPPTRSGSPAPDRPGSP